MIESAPYITPADPLPATSVVQSSVIPQVPLVQSTQILTQPSIVASQAIPAASMVASTPVMAAPQVSYVPVGSSIPPVARPPVSSGVKVVPIYDYYKKKLFLKQNNYKTLLKLFNFL